VKKQIIEAKREAIAKRAKEASNNYIIGNIKTRDVKEPYQVLKSD